MKKVLVGILVGVIIFTPLESRANSFSYSQPECVDGIPEDVRSIAELVGMEYNICPELLEAMAFRESRFMPDVINGNCWGIMQVNVKVHEDRISEYGWTDADMLDPYKNMMIAADYLRELYDTYEDNGIVLALYSGNKKAVASYKEYGFLCSYAEDVLQRAYEYEDIHKKH